MGKNSNSDMMDYKARHLKVRFTKKIFVVVGFGYTNSNEIFIPLGQSEIEMDVDDSVLGELWVSTNGFTIPYQARTSRLVTHFGFLFDLNWLICPIQDLRLGFGPTVLGPKTIVQFNKIKHLLPEPDNGENSLS